MFLADERRQKNLRGKLLHALLNFRAADERLFQSRHQHVQRRFALFSVVEDGGQTEREALRPLASRILQQFTDLLLRFFQLVGLTVDVHETFAADIDFFLRLRIGLDQFQIVARRQIEMFRFAFAFSGLQQK